MSLSSKFARAAVAATLTAAGTAVGYKLTTRALRGRYSFAGKTCVVTGGSRGFGLVIARRLVRAGAAVAICARDADQVRRAADELARRGEPGRVVGGVCDVSNREDVRRFLKTVTDALGPVDLLVNNAGLISFGPAASLTAQDYEDSLATHFWGPYFFTEEVLPMMKKRRSGRILNVSSIGGRVPLLHGNAYTVGKHALVGYSEGLRMEAVRHGVYVTTVCPGLMRTGSPRHALIRGKHEAEYAGFKILDSLPGLSCSAERAADAALEAVKEGRGEVIVPGPFSAAATFHDLFRNFSLDLLGLLGRTMPDAPGPIGDQVTPARRGYEVETPLTRSALTGLTQRAAVRNNEV
ncbi:SDR family NAD(P)-dependent oxidoreductase [Alienimonas sp. DA493]|uniref:SDR family NAD(P)-dependent oxidoreductase n=1 Tax=Alienimonas sp. DA493 TaxID=3373605 RepID=UPI003754E4B7